MQINVDTMARELGMRPNQLRIELGLPTRLQKLVRDAKDFASIAALSSEFEESYSTCGPKFEPEEKEEYKSRRAELFSAYLHGFQTLESFEGFANPSRVREGDAYFLIIITESESSEASNKFAKLFAKKLAEADTLEKSLALRKYITAIPSDRNARGISTWKTQGILAQAVESKVTARLQEAKSLDEKIELLKKVSDVLSNSRDKTQDWNFVWKDIDSFDEMLRIEKEVPTQFQDWSSIRRTLANLAVAKARSLTTFKDRVEFAVTLASRDGYRADEVFTAVLWSIAEVARSASQISQLIKAWQNRRISDHRERPVVPDVFYRKYDEFCLESTKGETDLEKLRSIRDKSPYSTETHRTADRLILEILLPQLDTLDSEEAIEAFVKANKEVEHSSEARRRKEAIRNQRVYEILETATGNEPEDKRALIGVYHSLKETDKEGSRKALLKLARQFPAEAVDELPARVD